MQYTIDTQSRPLILKPDSEMERVAQNCKNILRTQMGEVPYDRMLGLSPELYSMPVMRMNEIILNEAEMALAFEPRAKVIAARAYQTEKMETVIEVTIEIEEGNNG